CSYSLLRAHPYHSQHSFPTRRSSDLTNPYLIGVFTIASLPSIFSSVSHCFNSTTTTECSSSAFPVIRKSTRFEEYGMRNSIATQDRKSTRLNSSHVSISYAVFCLKKN